MSDPRIPDAVRARMTCSYDAGSFDKDEQGWCSHVHELRFDGDAYVVRVHGDFNGQRPFDQTFTLAVLAIDEATEIVTLSSDRGFDLRAQRLIGSAHELARLRQQRASELAGR